MMSIFYNFIILYSCKLLFTFFDSCIIYGIIILFLVYFCVFICINKKFCILLQANQNIYTVVKVKNSRLEALKMLISSMELSSQEEVLKVLEKEGFKLTQATLSRDLKQLKVAKAASMNGKYVYVLPNETMYRRVTTPRKATEMLQRSGYVSVNISGQLAIVKTRPGYASALAYDIDNSDSPYILGSIAGDDTIFIALREGATRGQVLEALSYVIPEIG